MQYDNTPYFLALNRIPQVGPRTIAKLLAIWPNLAEVFNQSTKALGDARVSSNIAEAICGYNFDNIEIDLQWAKEINHHVLTWESPNYPKLLKEIYDPPAVLYAIGDLACFDLPAIALVGSRNPSINGKETALNFAKDLASEGLCIVSGLALGIDGQSHLGCLKANGKTIAVLGTGIDYIYPQAHYKLAAQISKTGLLISEFPLQTRPNARHFPRRNRIISGLSLATLVIEAAIKSGSLITARLALEQNRDVLAIPGSIFNQQARGCHALLQEGAKLVTCCQDILNELNLEHYNIYQKNNNVNEQLKNCDSSKESLLVKYIGFEPTTIDQIVERSGASITKIMCDLTTLELQGIIKVVAGGYMRAGTTL